MSVAVVATVFGLVALAELPDKTMIATVVMGSRSRPLYVWLGASGAFSVHVALAVAAGRLVELLPHRAVETAVTVLFFAGAIVLLALPERPEQELGEDTAGRRDPGAGAGAWTVAATAFGVVVVGELGDLTQILTVNLAARYHQPASVFVGALAGLMATSAAGAFGGRALLRWLPLGWVRRAGGVALLGLGAYNLYGLVR